MKIICLNAGHGGRDPGAVSPWGHREAPAALAITLACREHLTERYTGHRLVLPRDDDTWVGLTTRKQIAEREGGDLYVSMHLNFARNAAGQPIGHGFESFIYTSPRAETVRYQQAIHTAVYSYLQTLSIADRGMKRSQHWEPTNIMMPVVLLEYWFLSNQREAALTTNPEILKRAGEATARGIAQALQLPQKQTPAPVEPWPPVISPLPQIQRTIGVKVDGQKTNEIGFLINNQTYTRASFNAELAGHEVTGHGDHIDWKTKGRR